MKIVILSIHLCMLMASTSRTFRDESADCPVCFEGFRAGSRMQLKCGHRFCVKCMLQMRYANCPKCRRPFTDLAIPVFQDETSKYHLSTIRKRNQIWWLKSMRNVCLFMSIFSTTVAILGGKPLTYIIGALLIQLAGTSIVHNFTSGRIQRVERLIKETNTLAEQITID